MTVALITVGVLGLVAFVLLFALVGIRHDALLPRARMNLPVAASFLLLVVVVASDWPGTRMGAFWSEHGVLAVLAAGVPVLGVGYFLFESHVARTEDELDANVAVLGRRPIVDLLITVDRVLSDSDPSAGQRVADELLGGIVTWADVLGRSRAGREDLIRLGALHRRLNDGDHSTNVQLECRRLAWDLAERSDSTDREGLVRP